VLAAEMVKQRMTESDRYQALLAKLNLTGTISRRSGS
jgi:hypothetical protein